MFAITVLLTTIIATKSLTQQNDLIKSQGISQTKYNTISSLQSVQYLQHVKTLDLLISFLHCNKTIGYSQLNNLLQKQIASEKYGVKGHYQQISCNSNTQQNSSFKIDDNTCWKCGKQFKNKTYLSLHYFVKHRNLLKRFNSSRISQYHKDQSEYQQLVYNRFVESVLNQKLHKLITSSDLKILFQSQAPQDHIQLYCQKLFQRVFDKLAHQDIKGRYGHFIVSKNSRQLCMLIAMKMYETSPWVTVGKYIGIIILVAGGVWYVHWVFDQYQSDQRTKSGPIKMKKY